MFDDEQPLPSSVDKERPEWSSATRPPLKLPLKLDAFGVTYPRWDIYVDDVLRGPPTGGRRVTTCYRRRVGSVM